MRRTLWITIAVGVVACGGGTKDTTPTGPTAVNSLSVTPATVSLVVGATTQLAATPKDASGTGLTGRTIAWSSNAAAIATVSASGLVTAVAAGTTFIKASSEAKSDSALVTVSPPVASVVVTPASPTVDVGATSQFTATTKDAGGATLTARTIVWSSLSSAVATVSASGLATGVSPGTAFIKATSEGRSDSSRVTVLTAPFLSRPFNGEFLTINPMDHDTPEEFVDQNGYFVSSWGERIAAFSSHSGYDFVMPTGVSLIAAVAGTVRLVSANFFCPPLNRNVDQTTLYIQTLRPGGRTYVLRYDHMSRIDVADFQVVSVGSPLGLSGNTGCSGGSHLHFELDLLPIGFTNFAGAQVDPYGWTGAGVDPWEVNPRGTKSYNLWLAGQAPLVRVGYDTIQYPLNSAGTGTGGKAVAIQKFSFTGPSEATNPNVEFVEVTIDTRFYSAAAYDLTGHYIKNNNGDRFNFPAGTTLRPASPIRVYTGSGTNTTTELYWGRSTGVYANLGDCAQLVFPNGTFYLMSIGVSCR